MAKIVFASPHAFPDVASGAAVSLVEMLNGLKHLGGETEGNRGYGWHATVICGDKFDGKGHRAPDRLKQLPGVTARLARIGNATTTVYTLSHRNIGVLLASPEDVPEAIPRAGLPDDDNPTPYRCWPWLCLLDAYLARHQPDLLLFYGGGWAGRAIRKIAQRHGIPQVLWLRNTSYARADLFEGLAATLVPSQYAASVYQNALGVQCDVACSPVDLSRIQLDTHTPQYVTFVSPIPEKGSFLIARLASELSRQRPDIQLRIVIGRGSMSNLDDSGLNLRNRPNIHITPATSDPRDFLSQALFMIAPSVWGETFYRTGVEAMSQGIPSIVSDRGALPEVVSSTGVVLPIPSWMTTATRRTPSVSEVAPWLSAIARLWDNREEVTRLGQLAKHRQQTLYPFEKSIQQHHQILSRAASTRPPAWLKSDAPLPDLLKPLDVEQPQGAAARKDLTHWTQDQIAPFLQ